MKGDDEEDEDAMSVFLGSASLHVIFLVIFSLEKMSYCVNYSSYI